jgi:hypothetical protein
VFFQFHHFFWTQAPDKVLFPEKLEKGDEAPMLSFAREVVKACIPLTITCVCKMCPASRAGQAFWEGAAIFCLLSVNDSEEVKNCLRRELEIFMAVKPNAMTHRTEVERNSLSVIPREGLCV